MSKSKDAQKIQILVNDCKKCILHKTRNHPVFGEGSLDAKIMLIGEAPGYNEDIQGRPFVGKAGKILDELLDSVGFKRKEVYIANIVKCRPPENRNPLSDEISKCKDYLDRQIEIIKPEIIAPMGNFAASYIFEKFGLKVDKISNVHGKLFEVNTVFGAIKVIPLYHPAVATYNINKKTTLLDDFKLVKKVIEKKDKIN